MAWAVEQRIRLFALLNDQHDHDGLAAMFTEDGSFTRPTEPEAPVIGREAIRAFFRERPKRLMRHVMANTIVTAMAGHEVEAHSYVVLHTADQTLVGNFTDRLVLRNNIWLFEARIGSLAF